MAIHDAVNYNKMHILKCIINNSNGNINFNSENGYVLLLKSVHNGNLEILKYLIELGNLNNTYFDSMTAFKSSLCVIQMSAIVNKLDFLKYLIETVKVDFNKVIDENGRNILAISALYGNNDMSKYLINEQKMDINWKNSFETGSLFRESILHYACHGGDLELVKYLINDLNMDYNVITIREENILHYAGESKNLNLIKYLIKDLEMDVNAINRYNMTVLPFAIHGGNIEIINYLLNKITIDDNKKIDLLYVAANSNDFDVFKTILDHDNIRDYVNETRIDNVTLLHFATRGCNLDTVFYVSEVLNIKPSLNKYGDNILIHACSDQENIEVIKYIIKNLSINANDINHKGDTLLINSASKRHLNIVKYLIEHENIDINQHSRLYNPLIVAAKNGDLKMAKYLIDNNANVNFQNRDYNVTALHAASFYPSLNVLQYLILYGKADINIENDNYENAFEIYKKRQRKNNITWFEDYLEHLSNPNSTFETLIHDAVCDINLNPRSCKFYYV
jgi:ankyrin repeat protein